MSDPIAALTDLSIAADTAELLLRQWCPDEASSLRQKVTAAKKSIEDLRADSSTSRSAGRYPAV